MKSMELPKGEAALRQDILGSKWDVSGLFTLDNNIIPTVDRTLDRWGARLPIESVHGCPMHIPWNSGRVISISNIVKWTMDDIESLYKEYNDRGISVYNTFSNHLLTKSHLEHKDANGMLELLTVDNNNGIIIASDLLHKYVKSNYPNIKQKSSIIKITVEHPVSRTAEDYKRLLDVYDMVVLHPDDNFDIPLLEELSPYADRIEILVNEPCVVNCKIRKLHYTSVAQKGLSFKEELSVNNEDEHEWNFFNLTEAIDCGLDVANKPKINVRTCASSGTEVIEMYNMGYRHFKLQGRDTHWYKMRYDICSYMYEQEIIYPIEVKL